MGKHGRSRHRFGEHEMRKLSCNLQEIEFPLQKARSHAMRCDKFSPNVDK